jgi:hypothetical protein
VDRCVERLQLEGLDQHRRLHSLEEKFYLRIILVTGEENESLTSGGTDSRHGPVKVLAPDFRHHHVANDQIEGILENLAQTLDTSGDRSNLKRAGNQVIVENCPEIIAIFQEQDPLAGPEHMVPRDLGDSPCRLSRVKLESSGLLHGTVAEV